MKIHLLKKVSSDAHEPISNPNQTDNELKETKSLPSVNEQEAINIPVRHDYSQLPDDADESKDSKLLISLAEIGIQTTVEELKAAGFNADDINVLKYLFSGSLAICLSQSFNYLSLQNLLIRFTQFLLTDKRGINKADADIISIQNSRLARFYEWLTSGTWTTNTVLPFTAETMLKRVIGIERFYDSAQKMSAYFGSLLMASLLGPELYYYKIYPAERENTLSQIFFSRTPDKIALITFLAQPRHWFALTIFLGFPFFAGLVSALNAARDSKVKPLDNVQIRKLLNHLRDYHPGWGNDVFYWLPGISSFYGMSSTLNTIRRVLLWDKRITPDIRLEFIKALCDFALKSNKLTQLYVHVILSALAIGVALADLVKLRSADVTNDVNNEELLSFLLVKIKATATLQYLSQHYQLPEKQNSRSRPLMRYLVANYLNLGKSEALARWLQPLFWLYKTSQLYVQGSFWVITALGLARAYQYFQDEATCLAQDRIWSFINDINDYNCTVCADLPVSSYRQSFTMQDCLDDYLRIPRTAEQTIALFRRAKPEDGIKRLDLSNQIYPDTNHSNSLTVILPAIKRYFPELEQLLLGRDALFFGEDNPYLSPYTLGPVGMRAVINFMNLTASITDISLNFLNIEDQLLANFILGLPRNTSLSTLHVRGNKVGAATMQAFSMVLPYLPFQHIILSNNKLTGLLHYITPGLPYSQLQILELENCLLVDEDAYSLASSIPKSLKNLLIEDNQIGDRGIETVCSKLPDLSIEYLAVSSNTFGDPGLQSLTDNLPYTNLKQIFLLFIKATEASIKPFFATVLNDKSKIERLTIGSIYLTDSAVSDVPMLLMNNTALISFSISGNMTDQFIQRTSYALPTSKLQILLIFSEYLTDNSPRYIAAILPNSPHLRSLLIKSSSISTDSLGHFAPVMPNSKLQSFAAFGFTEAANKKNLSSFIESLSQSSSLTALYLEDCHFRDNDVQKLMVNLPPNLQILDLLYNPFTGLGVKSIATRLVKSPRHAHELWLNWLDPNHRIVQENPTPNTALTNLYLDGSRFNRSDLQPLCDALPWTNIPLQNLYLDQEACVVSAGSSLKPPLPLQLFSRLLHWVIWPVSYVYQQICALGTNKLFLLPIEVISDNKIFVENCLISDDDLRDGCDLLSTMNDNVDVMQEPAIISPVLYQGNSSDSLITVTSRDMLASSHTPITLPEVGSATPISFSLLGILSTLSVAGTGLWLLRQWCAKQTNYAAPISSATRNLYRFFQCKKTGTEAHNNHAQLSTVIPTAKSVTSDKQNWNVSKKPVSSSVNTERVIYVHGF